MGVTSVSVRPGGVSAVLLAVLSLMLGGCDHRPVTSAGARSNPGAPPASSSASATEAEVVDAIAAYRAMWKDLAEASATANEDAPYLGDHATGGALRLLKYGLAKQREEGVVGKGTPRLYPQIVSGEPRKQPTKYVLRDCADDTNWLEYKKTGGLKNQVPGGHHRVDATVEIVNGTWKVTYMYLHEVGTC